MIYEEVRDLVKTIENEECFQKYKESLKVFEIEEIRSLMKQLDRLTEEKESLSRFGKYGDTSEISHKITQVRRELYRHPQMITYLDAYQALNTMLDEITEIVFDGISEELAKGRIGRSYARYSR